MSINPSATDLHELSKRVRVVFKEWTNEARDPSAIAYVLMMHLAELIAAQPDRESHLAKSRRLIARFVDEIP